ncbi:MAG TPA: hypothetical protein VEK38_02345 [Candidatus Bathyarchaeia archaeon]|nr:hypothetical protein [Candidatus Bathyarchaeia archaeon]
MQFKAVVVCFFLFSCMIRAMEKDGQNEEVNHYFFDDLYQEYDNNNELEQEKSRKAIGFLQEKCLKIVENLLMEGKISATRNPDINAELADRILKKIVACYVQNPGLAQLRKIYANLGGTSRLAEAHSWKIDKKIAWPWKDTVKNPEEGRLLGLVVSPDSKKLLCGWCFWDSGQKYWDARHWSIYDEQNKREDFHTEKGIIKTFEWAVDDPTTYAMVVREPSKQGCSCRIELRSTDEDKKNKVRSIAMPVFRHTQDEEEENTYTEGQFFVEVWNKKKRLFFSENTWQMYAGTVDEDGKYVYSVLDHRKYNLEGEFCWRAFPDIDRIITCERESFTKMCLWNVKGQLASIIHVNQLNELKEFVPDYTAPYPCAHICSVLKEKDEEDCHKPLPLQYSVLTYDKDDKPYVCYKKVLSDSQIRVKKCFFISREKESAKDVVFLHVKPYARNGDYYKDCRWCYWDTTRNKTTTLHFSRKEDHLFVSKIYKSKFFNIDFEKNRAYFDGKNWLYRYKSKEKINASLSKN